MDKVENNGEVRTFTGKLVVDNPNGYPIQVKRGNFTVSNDPLTLGDCKILEKRTLPRNGAETVDFQLNVKNKALLLGGLQQLGSLLTGGEAKVTIQGEIKACTYGIFCKKYRVNESLKLKL
ncbi:LEA type 2 family protein [Luteibaculum oceani]|nr:LEA type 2 family protein [Luteibaculum oceani]